MHLAEHSPSDNTQHRVSPSEFAITKAVVEALLKAIDEAVPWTTPTSSSRFARSKFNEECKSAVVRKLRLRRQIWKRRLDGSTPKALLEEYRQARNKAKQLIRKNLQQNHRDKVTEAAKDMQKVWKLVKWAKNRDTPYAAYTPPMKLDGVITQNPQRKARALAESFFPTPPQADLSDTEHYEYPPPLETPPITSDEITAVFKRVPKNKAPGPDYPERSPGRGTPPANGASSMAIQLKRQHRVQSPGFPQVDHSLATQT